MRFDTPVFFQSITPGIYNPTTGNYDQDKVGEDKVFSNVTDAGV